ncbi:ribosome small subunit-dependent GTPase A [Ureaplasma diversum]|uniref:Small ribosomal subunit biogenesis GTPase RsgA n=1 Tax=Ureaplasma diversum NCTC 246 TaxID=1188241 RepID=A0A084EYH7_9BACT|nr:ribosome small subunit-dependent GTPase A [Ureaplasma diversum]KEZ23019.1 GTPase EngC [Ureaplasma diversum NCTC 246]
MKAKIVSNIANQFSAYIYDLNQELKVVPKGIFLHDSHILKPMVGDDVIIEQIDDQYVIVELEERYNQLVRPKVANVDIMLVVVSIVEPSLNTLALNKYLAFYEARNIKNVYIAFSKYDLVEDKTWINNIINDYRKDNYTVFNLSDQNDFNQLKSLIKDHTVCLAGNSGVGKTTLINRLDPSLDRKTQQISKFLNRGKHTTTSTKLIRFADGFLVDTPGFGSLEVNLSLQQMATAYNDFANVAKNCKFSNCLHINEPACAIKKAVAKNLISYWRYHDYLKIQNQNTKEQNLKDQIAHLLSFHKQ